MRLKQFMIFGLVFSFTSQRVIKIGEYEITLAIRFTTHTAQKVLWFRLEWLSHHYSLMIYKKTFKDDRINPMPILLLLTFAPWVLGGLAGLVWYMFF